MPASDGRPALISFHFLSIFFKAEGIISPRGSVGTEGEQCPHADIRCPHQLPMLHNLSLPCPTILMAPNVPPGLRGPWGLFSFISLPACLVVSDQNDLKLRAFLPPPRPRSVVPWSTHSQQFTHISKLLLIYFQN